VARCVKNIFSSLRKLKCRWLKQDGHLGQVAIYSNHWHILISTGNSLMNNATIYHGVKKADLQVVIWAHVLDFFHILSIFKTHEVSKNVYENLQFVDLVSLSIL
jgi:hypothetical protein